MLAWLRKGVLVIMVLLAMMIIHIIAILDTLTLLVLAKHKVKLLMLPFYQLTLMLLLF